MSFFQEKFYCFVFCSSVDLQEKKTSGFLIVFNLHRNIESYSTFISDLKKEKQEVLTGPAHACIIFISGSFCISTVYSDKKKS